MVICVQIVFKEHSRTYNQFAPAATSVSGFDLSATVPVDSIKEFSDTLISMFREKEEVMVLTPCNLVTEELIGNVVLVKLDSVASINIVPVDKLPVGLTGNLPTYPSGTGGN